MGKGEKMNEKEFQAEFEKLRKSIKVARTEEDKKRIRKEMWKLVREKEKSVPDNIGWI